MKTRAIILGKFDLGYLLKLEGGEPAQLRVIEMKGEELDCHLRSQEFTLVGKSIDVYILHQGPMGVLVSQYSKMERGERKKQGKLKDDEQLLLKVGESYRFVVIQKTSWGVICQRVNGYAEGAIIGGCEMIGEDFVARITGKTEAGSLLLTRRVPQEGL